MIKRNKFSLSHIHLTSMDMGQLIPIAWYTVQPGDSMRLSSSGLIRFSPMAAPTMHSVHIRIHHWFVTYNQIWDNWEDFITGGEDGLNASVHPYIQLGNLTKNHLLDYLGIPPGDYTGKEIKVNALVTNAYAHIFNHHYRDQDLVPEITIDKTDGPNATPRLIQRCTWPKDYFTTSRPWAAKGQKVRIPIQATAPITGIASQVGKAWGGAAGGTDSKGTSVNYANAMSDNSPAQGIIFEKNPLGNHPNIFADLSAATGIPITDLRLALAVQRYQERMGRFGSRYAEWIQYLGVRPSNLSLREPLYIGGGRQVAAFSEILQTGEGTNPVGTLRGHGIAAMRTRRLQRFFNEHGIVMSLMSVIPKPIYTQQIRRDWFPEVKEDYHQRELEHVGEQEVYNKEVYALHSDPHGIFGYQMRYDHLRYMPSLVTAEMRDELKDWHFGRIHESDVALNRSFIEATPTKRVFFDKQKHSLRVMINNQCQIRRMMSRQSVPRTY